MFRPYVVALAVCLGIVAGTGCNTDPLFAKEKAPVGPVTRIDAPGERIEVPDIAVIQAMEYDLVEEVLLHRAQYHKALIALRDYYRQRGRSRKLQWAEYELADAEKIKPFKYILDAEIPMQWLRPDESIPEADAMYTRGVELMKEGGHGLPALYREDLMHQALKTFVDLIKQYPSSDKIDDAAFCCGEIYKEYFKNQEEIAVQWYERAYTWDPQTPHPARFQEAVVYDFRMHDRARALELYHLVLRHENENKSNASFAARRIDELSKGIQLARPQPPRNLVTQGAAERTPPETTDKVTADASEPSATEDVEP